MSTPVSIIICHYNGLAYLPDLVKSIKADSAEHNIAARYLFIDDHSPDEASNWLAEHLPDTTPTLSFECIRLAENRRFAGANNAGWAHVLAHQADSEYVALLNMDTEVAAGWLRAAIGTLKAHPDAAAVQCKLMLHPQTDRFNTAGNRSQYLGFGFVTALGEVDTGQYDQSREIDFASGAAMVIRRSALEQVGLFDPAFGNYMEDVDLSWRLRLAGHTVRLAPGSVVFHKYTPSAPTRSYAYLERNRWVLLLTVYRWRTLLLLAPALLLMECGQWLFAAMHGLLGTRLGIYGHFMRPGTWRYLRERRQRIQQLRTISDQQFIGSFASRIEMPGPLDGEPRPGLLERVANPIFDAYWRFIRRWI